MMVLLAFCVVLFFEFFAVLLWVFEDEDNMHVLFKIYKILRLVITTPLWCMLYMYDGIVSNARAYLKHELINFAKIAQSEIEDMKGMKDRKYEWNVQTMASNMIFPFNYIVPLTIYTGIPQK